MEARSSWILSAEWITNPTPLSFYSRPLVSCASNERTAGIVVFRLSPRSSGESLNAHIQSLFKCFTIWISEHKGGPHKSAQPWVQHISLKNASTQDNGCYRCRAVTITSLIGCLHVYPDAAGEVWQRGGSWERFKLPYTLSFLCNLLSTYFVLKNNRISNWDRVQAMILYKNTNVEQLRY